MTIGDNHQTSRQDVEDMLVDVLPFLLSGRYLKKQTFYRINKVHSYTRDISAALLGVGLSFPGAKVLAANHDSGLSSAFWSLPWYEWVPGGVVLLLMVIMRVYIRQESVDKKARNVDECEKIFDVKYFELQQALKEPRPLNKLRTIKKSVDELVARNTREQSYKFADGWAPGTDGEAKIRAKQLCDSYEIRWK